MDGNGAYFRHFSSFTELYEQKRCQQGRSVTAFQGKATSGRIENFMSKNQKNKSEKRAKRAKQNSWLFR